MKKMMSPWNIMIVFGAIVSLMFPADSGAALKPKVVDVAMELSTLHPALNGEYAANVRIRAQEDIPDLTVVVELPQQIELVSDSVKWSGSLAAGNSIELKPGIRIVSEGRFSIRVRISTPENRVRETWEHLNFILENGRNQVSGEPFIRMDLDAAATPEERQAVTRFKAAHTEIIVQPAAGRSAPAKWTATITGKAEYVDVMGNSHPIRLAKIQVSNEDPDAQYAVLGSSNTGFDGTFTIQAVCQEEGMIPDVQLRVYSSHPDNLFTMVCPSKTDPFYTLLSDIRVDCPAGNITINVKTGQPQLNQTNDDVIARAFAVLDGMLQAYLESYAIRVADGYMDPVRYIDTVFPASSCYNTGEDCIQIAHLDSQEWDLVYHEFYHFFSREAAKTKFNNGPGGAHDGSSAIPDYGKDTGIRLAWDEGIATFMSITTQLEDRSRKDWGIPCPSMPCLGDRKYEEIEGTAWSIDLETVGQTHPYSEGYGSEFSVLGTLYDLWDGDRDGTDLQGVNCKDYIQLSLHSIWKLWNTGDWDDVSKFYAYVSSILMGADANLVPMFSCPFAMNHIAPMAYDPREGDMLSRSQCPTFTWAPYGDSTPGYFNDEFILGIFKGGLSYTNIVFAKFDLKTTSWTPTKDEWEAITHGATNSTRYYWYVMGWNTQIPRTPPSNVGMTAFISNAHSFVLRPNIYAQGMMGCQDKDPALFFSGIPLEINPDSNEYPFHGSGAGKDYDGDPIYFILDGKFILSQSMVRVDIEMYSDPGYTTHIRTDRAEAYSWNEWFYDFACDLIRDTTAGCRPIWFAVKFADH
ncbi:hypothetical protein JXA40_02520 [bacterium]|nr:hypothetical protein [candidate division CSSED10-310 bacterium]